MRDNELFIVPPRQCRKMVGYKSWRDKLKQTVRLIESGFQRKSHLTGFRVSTKYSLSSSSASTFSPPFLFVRFRLRAVAALSLAQAHSPASLLSLRDLLCFKRFRTTSQKHRWLERTLLVLPLLLLVRYRRSLVVYLFVGPFRYRLMQTQLHHCLPTETPRPLLSNPDGRS